MGSSKWDINKLICIQILQYMERNVTSKQVSFISSNFWCLNKKANNLISSRETEIQAFKIQFLATA